MSDLIVVTSAAGGVGRPLVERLSAAGEHVRAFVKNDQQAGVARRAGAAEVVVGLAIIMTIFRTRRSASVDDASLLKY